MSMIRIISFGSFTPLESPGIYDGDAINREHQLLIEGGVKVPPFLTGLSSLRSLISLNDQNVLNGINVLTIELP